MSTADNLPAAQPDPPTAVHPPALLAFHPEIPAFPACQFRLTPITPTKIGFVFPTRLVRRPRPNSPRLHPLLSRHNKGCMRRLLLLATIPCLLLADDHFVKFTRGPFEVMSDAGPRP